MAQFEKEVLQYLDIPKIPTKKWDGKSAFKKGVAVMLLKDGREVYGVCTFDPDNGDNKPYIIKVFGIEQFTEISDIFVVPSYMSAIEDVDNMDLDEHSKEKAKEILNEATELETEGTKEENPMEKLPEWIFHEINSKEEAVAWLKNFQSRNKQKGRIPTTDENIKLRLYSIYTELQKKAK